MQCCHKGIQMAELGGSQSAADQLNTQPLDYTVFDGDV